MLDVNKLNSLSPENAEAELVRCCGSREWARRMAARRPFATPEAVFAASDEIWNALSKEDWLEAFSHHPRIGDTKVLEAKFAATRVWASGEQRGTASAAPEVLERLLQGNRDYEAKYGFIFIICATGKSADEMLAALESRLSRDGASELATAAGEQAKITKIRLEKLMHRSPITTHILDVARGKPAAGVAVLLERQKSGEVFEEIGRGETDSDGRVATLMPPGTALDGGVYRLTFSTGAYFTAGGTPGFYPFVTVTFEITQPTQHYHVPLLLSPFGYSTYRGS